MEQRLRSHYESLARAIGFTRAADAKTAPLLAAQVAMAGALATRMNGLWTVLSGTSWGPEQYAVAVFLSMYGALVAISTGLAADVYIPRNPRTGASLIYFEDIASMDFESFSERVSRLEAEEIEGQLIQQVHAVSLVASTKMRLARWAYLVSVPATALWAVLMVWSSI